MANAPLGGETQEDEEEREEGGPAGGAGGEGELTVFLLKACFAN